MIAIFQVFLIQFETWDLRASGSEVAVVFVPHLRGVFLRTQSPVKMPYRQSLPLPLSTSYQSINLCLRMTLLLLRWATHTLHYYSTSSGYCLCSGCCTVNDTLWFIRWILWEGLREGLYTAIHWSKWAKCRWLLPLPMAGWSTGSQPASQPPLLPWPAMLEAEMVGNDLWSWTTLARSLQCLSLFQCEAASLLAANPLCAPSLVAPVAPVNAV